MVITTPYPYTSDARGAQRRSAIMSLQSRPFKAKSRSKTRKTEGEQVGNIGRGTFVPVGG